MWVFRAFYVEYHVICMWWLFYLFPSNLDIFSILFLVLLLWVDFLILCWMEVVRVGILVSFQSLAGRVSVSTAEYYVGSGFFIKGFYYVEIYSLYTHFGKSFYHELMLDFIKCFFFIYLKDHVIFVFSFINMVYHSVWFLYVEPSLWHWDESNLISCMIFLCAVGFSLLIFS